MGGAESYTEMLPFGGGMPHCKRCGLELDGGEESCPRCHFNPKQMAMKLATVMLIGAIALIPLAYLSLFVIPRAGSYLVSGSFLLFGLAAVVFVLGLAVTPYRFGRLFSRF